MGWQPVIEYADESDIVLPPPVRKQVWDGEKFVPMTLYKHKGVHNISMGVFGTTVEQATLP